MNNLTDHPTWHALHAHQQSIAQEHMRDWFTQDKERFAAFSLQIAGIFCDFSHNRLQTNTLDLLVALAKAANLSNHIDALFSGSLINNTEKRPALHMALRDSSQTTMTVNGQNISAAIQEQRVKIAQLVDEIHGQQWLGATGKPIKHIVNIGIGGSYLGPLLCTQALKDHAISDLQFHFISTIDGDLLKDVLALIDPETTLFIISSKTFTTLETLTNATSALNWMKSQLADKALTQHFVAVTANKEKAIEFGILEKNIFTMWDWVGGRYSVWSAIGLPLALQIGNDGFNQFLVGAHEMDVHFRTADFSNNLPVLLALIGVWYINFFGTTAQAIIPYSYRLRSLVSYLQQADMESNGKGVDRSANAITHATSPVIFGEEGCIGQHAYHQLLHQGQQLIPVDFIFVGKKGTTSLHDDALVASGLSQAQALMRGKTMDEARAELIAKNYSALDADFLASHQTIAGNKPCNILFLDSLSPKNLGALLALYEHKIFVQGVIWGINSFDQWGVELGKQLLPNILQQLQNPSNHSTTDCATSGLIKHFQHLKDKA